MCRASLDKLAIRGIRAFDDKHTNVIQFQSPVTVIVGTNGTGKTVTLLALAAALVATAAGIVIARRPARV